MQLKSFGIFLLAPVKNSCLRISTKFAPYLSKLSNLNFCICKAVISNYLVVKICEDYFFFNKNIKILILFTFMYIAKWVVYTPVYFMELNVKKGLKNSMYKCVFCATQIQQHKRILNYLFNLKMRRHQVIYRSESLNVSILSPFMDVATSCECIFNYSIKL